jgi:transposase-like protein
MLPICPTCGSKHTVKNGRIHHKKSKYQCQYCGRQFVENPTKKVISQETKDLIDKLLLEKIPLAGIAIVTGGAEPWLQKYVNTKYAEVPQQLEVSDNQKGNLTIQCVKSFLL